MVDNVNNFFYLLQGMNEIIGPLYYIFASDPDLQWQGWFSLAYFKAETLVFFLYSSTYLVQKETPPPLINPFSYFFQNLLSLTHSFAL